MQKVWIHMVLSRLFQTKHHTLALAPPVASFSFSFSLCCVRLDQCYMFSHQLFVFCICIRICFKSFIHFHGPVWLSCFFSCSQLLIPFCFHSNHFLVCGFTLFPGIFATRMKTLSCTFMFVLELMMIFTASSPLLLPPDQAQRNAKLCSAAG